MNKKGFTLAELLAVFGLLAILALVTIPIITRVVNQNKNELYDIQIQNIEKGARNWGANHSDFLPEIDGESVVLTLEYLKREGYVDKDIKDPRNNKLFPNNLRITITYSNHDYVYTAERLEGSMTSNTQTDPNAPILVLNGSSQTVVEINTNYYDEGVIAKKVDGTTIHNIVSVITQNGTEVSRIDTSRLGEYTVTYKASDNGSEAIVTRQVRIVDTTKPTIYSEENFNLGTDIKSYDLLANAYANDNSNGKITMNVTSEMALGIPGTYQVLFTATDSSGNKTTKINYITIKNNAPTLTLHGDAVMNVEKGTVFTDPSIEAHSTTGEKIENVEVRMVRDGVMVNAIDTNVIGTYYILYKVLDNGLPFGITRKVVVK